MSGLNRVIIAGRLTADPEVRYTQQETAVCHFTIEIRGEGKDKEKARCVAYGGLAKVCGEYLAKGRLVAVEGRLQMSKVDSRAEIAVDNMQMLDSKFYNAAKKGGE